MKTVRDDVFPRLEAQAVSPFKDKPIRQGEIVEVDDAKSVANWPWIRTAEEGDDREGFVRQSFIVDHVQKPEVISQLNFVRICILAARVSKTNGGYLVARAWADSKADWSVKDIKSTVVGNEIGPFRFDQKEWDRLVGEHADEGILKEEIHKPDRQCIFASIQTKTDVTRLVAILTRPITSRDLYLAHHLGAQGAKGLQDGDQAGSVQVAIQVALGGAAPAQAFMNSRADLTKENGVPVSVAKFLMRLDALLDEGLTKAAELVGQLSADEQGVNIPAASEVPVSGGTTSGTLKLGKNGVFRDQLLAASGRTNIDPAALASLIDAEAAKINGVWNPNSKASTSSASGLTQFLKGTWRQMAGTAGTLLNETGVQNGLVVMSGNSFSVPSDNLQALLDLRFDPLQSITAAAEYGVQNLNFLVGKSVIAPNISDDKRAWFMYLAHHEGPQGAADAIKGTLSVSKSKWNGNVPGSERTKFLQEAGGNISEAYRRWLFAYTDRKIVPSRFRI